MNELIRCDEMARMLRVRPADAHKGTMGHALLAAGSHGMAGCAVLCAEACMRSGVGKATVHTPESNRIILQTAVPEAILLLSQPDDSHLTTAPQDMSSYQSIGIGPGIGLQASGAVEAYIRQSGALPMVVDADALRILAGREDLMERLRGRAVLTPHPGEMKALADGFGLKGTMETAANGMATRYGVVVVLKGHPTRICMSDGCVRECPRGNAGMASGGSGDVLTGLIAGLLAQGNCPKEAAQLGVWLHATAGDHTATELGQECMLARDITRHLPEAFRELHQQRESTADTGNKEHS